MRFAGALSCSQEKFPVRVAGLSLQAQLLQVAMWTVEKPGPQTRARMKRGKRKKQKQKENGAAALAVAGLLWSLTCFPRRASLSSMVPPSSLHGAPIAAVGSGGDTKAELV